MAASSSQNSSEIQELARFAVEQHNHKENGVLELVRVAKAEEQVVSGTLHHLTLEVMEAGKRMVYEAKVWVKPWIDFKEVLEFKYVSDLRDVFGWRSVAVDDPSIVETADFVLKALQQKSNSLVQLEILKAKAEVTEEGAAYEMILKVKKGEKEEKMKIAFHKDA